MSLIKRILPTSTNNETLPVIIDDPTEVTIARGIVVPWFNPARPALFKGITPDDQPASAFVWRDSGPYGRPGSSASPQAAGARPLGAKRPNLVTDTAAGKMCLQFGFGGDLTSSDPGALSTQSGVNYTSTSGYFFAGAFKVPSPGSGHPATTGGTLFSNGRLTNPTPTRVYIDTSTGYFQAIVLDRTDKAIGYGYDFRDNLWHNFILSYDPDTEKLVMYMDGVLSATATGVPNIAYSVLNWGIGSLRSDIVASPYIGYLGDLMMGSIPIAKGVYDAQRTTVQAYLQAKWHN